MPDISPAAVILGAMPSQGRAYETAISLKQQKKYDRERRTKEALASVDKMFQQMKEYGEEQDITALSNAFTSTKNPDDAEVVLNQTPVRTARGADYKVGLLERIQKARESAASIEQTRAATEGIKLNNKILGETQGDVVAEARLRRELAEFQLKEAVAIAPLTRKEARSRGLLLQAQITGAELANDATKFTTEATQSEWRANQELREARRSYETFEFSFESRMKTLQQTQANVADAALQLKSLLSTDRKGRALFGPVEGLGGRDRMELYSEMLDKATGPINDLLLTEQGRLAQAEIMSHIASLASTDAEVLAANVQRESALRSMAAQRLYPEANRLVTTEVSRQLALSGRTLESPDPTAAETFLAQVRTKVLAQAQNNTPSGDDATLSRFGIQKTDVWAVAVMSALDEYEKRFTQRTRAVNRSRQVTAVEAGLSKMIPPNATPEEVEAIRKRAYANAGLSADGSEEFSDETGEDFSLQDLDAADELLRSLGR